MGIGVLIGLWAWFARSRPTLILPTPAETARSLVDLTTNGVLLPALGRSLGRSLLGVGLALLIGLSWGAANGGSRWFAAISRPTLSALMALPPVVLVALGMVWLGPGPEVTRLVVVLVALPLIVVAVQEAILAIDRDLIEMARTFGLTRRRIARHVIAPGIASPVLAATSVTIGQALRVAVMAELLSAASGVGAEIALARSNLDTPALFAWSFALIATVILIESLILRPLTKRLLRWRDPTT